MVERRLIGVVAFAAALLSLSACARSPVSASSGAPPTPTTRATAGQATGGETTIAGGDVILDQPPDGTQPRLNADQAARKAGIDPTGTTITLVLYTSRQEHADSGEGLAHDHELAWDFHSTGCFPVSVGPGMESVPPCPATQQDVFVDANTGTMAGDWLYS